MLGGLLSRLAGSFGFGGGGSGPGTGFNPRGMRDGPEQMPQQMGQAMPNYANQMGYRGNMQNPEAAMMAQRYGGGQAGYGGMQTVPQMNPQMNTQMPDMSVPQMNPQMNTQIGGAMGNDQGFDDLMGGQGSIRQLGPATPNQGIGDLMGGQGYLAGNNLSAQQGDPSVLADMKGGMKENPFSHLGSSYQAPSWGGKDGYGGAGGSSVIDRAGSMMDPSKDGWSAYNAPSWGGKQGYGGKGGAGVIERAGSMMNPSLGGKGGFSMTKGASMASNLGDMAKRFKPMSKGGYSIGEMFKPGGMTNKLLGKGGKVGAAISSAPAWAMPAAGAAAFGVKHIMKRSKQKKHQKQQNAQRDQIKNAAANGQYVTGNLGSLSGPRNY